MRKTISIIVTGKVQGVFYRQSAREKARSLGVTGEVSNHPDGTVHIVASGNKEQLDDFIEWCKQGPPRAHVNSVIAEQKEYREFEKFIILR